MAPAKLAQSSASPTPGPSNTDPRDRIAEALYAWCGENHQIGHVFNQAELLAAGVIPDQDLRILLAATQYLAKKNLFKLHDLKSGGGLGWELISQERAANYAGLSRDEHLVYSCIDSNGAAGIWTKTIKARLQAHAKVLERVYKSLESKGLIKQMKSVKNPGRKMFIVASLQPNEEATGGAWFSDGQLDRGLMETIASVIELYVSNSSWIEKDSSKEVGQPIVNNKRKTPHDGFDKSKGKSKAAKIDDDQPRSISPELKHHKQKHQNPTHKTYVPHLPGYDGYPSLRDVTRHVMASKASMTALPENAIAQLLEVMVYDDRLSKKQRPPRPHEVVDDDSDEMVTTYRCFKTPGQLTALHQVERKAISDDSAVRKAARRQIELEDIGNGGSSEIPCMRCPAFDLCGDGGPVNVETCPYFDEWYVNIAVADREAGESWPGGEEFIQDGAKRKLQREVAIQPQVKAEREGQVL